MSVALSYSALRVEGAVRAASQSVPSGQSVDLYEVLIDTVGMENWLRFRFVAPQIARDVTTLSFDDVQRDLEHLCNAVAVPYLAEYDLPADVVVISLIDRPVAFGEAAPEATQLIEAFRIDGETCAWGEL